jgi:hypothetical protein
MKSPPPQYRICLYVPAFDLIHHFLVRDDQAAAVSTACGMIPACAGGGDRSIPRMRGSVEHFEVDECGALKKAGRKPKRTRVRETRAMINIAILAAAAAS